MLARVGKQNDVSLTSICNIGAHASTSSAQTEYHQVDGIIDYHPIPWLFKNCCAIL